MQILKEEKIPKMKLAVHLITGTFNETSGKHGVHDVTIGRHHHLWRHHFTVVHLERDVAENRVWRHNLFSDPPLPFLFNLLAVFALLKNSENFHDFGKFPIFRVVRIIGLVARFDNLAHLLRCHVIRDEVDGVPQVLVQKFQVRGILRLR